MQRSFFLCLGSWHQVCNWVLTGLITEFFKSPANHSPSRASHNDSPPTEGYDLKSKEIVDLINKGIIDPTKVTRLALENAVSVAGTILITEAIVYEEPEKDKKEQSLDMSMYE